MAFIKMEAIKDYYSSMLIVELNSGSCPDTSSYKHFVQVTTLIHLKNSEKHVINEMYTF
jgi:hypothetical protein